MPAAPFDTPIAMFLTRSVLRIGHGHAFTSNLNVTRTLHLCHFSCGFRVPRFVPQLSAVSQVRSYRHSDTWACYTNTMAATKSTGEVYCGTRLPTVSKFCAGTTLAVPKFVPDSAVFRVQAQPECASFSL